METREPRENEEQSRRSFGITIIPKATIVYVYCDIATLVFSLLVIPRLKQLNITCEIDFVSSYLPNRSFCGSHFSSFVLLLKFSGWSELCLHITLCGSFLNTRAKILARSLFGKLLITEPFWEEKVKILDMWLQ